MLEPCDESWEQMEGSRTRRLCRQCDKHVHDLSAVTERQARRLLSKGPGLCVRYASGPDGQLRFERAGGRTTRALMCGAFLMMACAPHAEAVDSACELDPDHPACQLEGAELPPEIPDAIRQLDPGYRRIEVPCESPDQWIGGGIGGVTVGVVNPSWKIAEPEPRDEPVAIRPARPRQITVERPRLGKMRAKRAQRRIRRLERRREFEERRSALRELNAERRHERKMERRWRRLVRKLVRRSRGS